MTPLYVTVMSAAISTHEGAKYKGTRRKLPTCSSRRGTGPGGSFALITAMLRRAAQLAGLAYTGSERHRRFAEPDRGSGCRAPWQTEGSSCPGPPRSGRASSGTEDRVARRRDTAHRARAPRCCQDSHRVAPARQARAPVRPDCPGARPDLGGRHAGGDPADVRGRTVLDPLRVDGTDAARLYGL